MKVKEYLVLLCLWWPVCASDACWPAIDPSGAWATAMGACILGPIAGVALFVSPPVHVPSTGVIVSVLALALGGTTLAYICFYWLIDHVGPTRTVIVTYLLPCMAVVYGVLLLHEAVNINALGGLFFVLLGIFLIGRKAHTHTPASEQAAQALPEQAFSQKKG